MESRGASKELEQGRALILLFLCLLPSPLLLSSSAVASCISFLFSDDDEADDTPGDDVVAPPTPLEARAGISPFATLGTSPPYATAAAATAGTNTA